LLITLWLRAVAVAAAVMAAAAAALVAFAQL